MITQREITERFRAWSVNLRERGQILARALKVRMEILATRSRIRGTCAELGKEVYGRMTTGWTGDLQDDPKLASYRVRIDGLFAELRSRRETLKEILLPRKEPEIPQGQEELLEWEQSISETVSEK